MNPRLLLIATGLASLPAKGGSSDHYSLDPVIVDYGGLSGSSPSYRVDFSTSPGGAGSSASYAVRSGFVAAPGVVIGIELTAPAFTLDESGMLQLGGSLIFEDATTLPLAPGDITWSVQSGPLEGIDSGGQANASAVYQDEPAIVHGTYQTFSDDLELTVLDTAPDNFGAYAGDGLGDDWQFQYFGPDNPNAAPGHVSDGSGLTNLFKYTAGLVPNNAASKFFLNVQAVTGEPDQKDIVFSPSLTDRNYTLEFSSNLSGWNPLGAPFAGNGSTQTVRDPAAGTRGFYRVLISKP